MKNITVYSTTTCPYCVMVKRYLNEKKLPFKDILLEYNPDAAREMIEKSGQMGVPVIEIEDQVIVGFNRPAIDAALAL